MADGELTRFPSMKRSWESLVDRMC